MIKMYDDKLVHYYDFPINATAYLLLKLPFKIIQGHLGPKQSRPRTPSPKSDTESINFLLERVPQDLFHSVYFEYEENFTHDRLLSLNYAFCHIKRLIKTSEPVYTD